MKKILLTIAIFLLAGGGYFGYMHFFKNSDEKTTLQTTKVFKDDIENLVTATGILQPRDYVDVGAQVSGQLKHLHVDIGDQVKKGQLLAEIDVTLFMAKVDASRAQLKYQEASLVDKKAKLEFAKLQHKRQEDMYKYKATSLEELQSAQIELKSAKANVAMLEAQIEQTKSSLRAEEANLEFTRIYAPMSGTVVSLSAKQGQTLNANQQAPTILQIADLSVMTVKAEVSEADVMRLKKGMEVYFKTMGRDKKWYSKLYKVEPTPTVTNNVVLYNALFDVDNTTNELMSSMTAQVFFVKSRAKDALLLPLSAVKRKSPNSKTATVEVLLKDQTHQKREVELGVSNRIYVQILSNVDEGEEIIIPKKTRKQLKRMRMPRI